MELLHTIAQQLEQGDDEQVAALTRQAIEEGLPAKQILDDGLIAGMAIVGNLFKKHQIFLPEVLLAAKAMCAGMELLKPLLIRDAIPTLGKVVIGTVQGDIHDIGKNLVAIMLKGAGFDIIDLGKDVPPQRFVDTAVREQAQVIAMSALLTTTMPVMKQVIDLIQITQPPKPIRTIVGGAPVSPEFAREIGADAYGYDAAHAVDVVKSIIAKGSPLRGG